MKVLRVGFLGAGFMSRTHISKLLCIPEIEITAVCDTAAGKAEVLVKECNLTDTKVFGDFDCMLENCKLDCLYVCIPPFAHDGQVEKAAEKGMHVFVEKPLGLSSPAAEKMSDTVRKAGVHSHVGYHMRYGYAVQKLKRLIDDGTAGKPVLFDARYDCNALHAPWWRDVGKSGGQVLEQAIHIYDMSLYLMGKPDAASGFTGNVCHGSIEGYTVEDVSVSSIRFHSGALGSISATNCAIPGQWNETMMVVFENLTTYFSSPNNAEFVYTYGGKTVKETVAGDNDMKLEESRAFIDSIKHDRKDSCNLEEGYRSLVLAETVIKSSGEGGKVLKINL